jgi:CHASE2 domain-containing sensor protein
VPTAGGYQQADAGGYQILLNYRSSTSLARSVTLSDVLANRLDPSWVKDRIVLIGVSAPSIDDAFYTPYSSQERRLQKMPGVVVHGQIVSQLLSAVLDGRRLFWFWPEWGEVLWIFGWSLTGGILVRVVRHPGQLVLAESVALGLLLGISVLMFFESGWVPMVAPTLGLIAAGTGVLGYSAYQAEQERIKAEKERLYIEQKAQEQEKNIALLQGLLKESTNYPVTTTETDSTDRLEAALTEETEMPPEMK